jgi:TolA-binding protein
MVDFAALRPFKHVQFADLGLKLGLLALYALASPVVVTAQTAPPAAMTAPYPLDPPSARLTTRMDLLDRQITELTGRIEMLEAELAAQKALQAQKLREEEALRASLALPAQTNVNATQAPSDPAAQEEPAAEAQVAPEAAETGEQLFQAAQQGLARGDYGGAEAKLTRLLAQFPDGPEALEARWLLGEARFVQSAWGPAAEAYLAYLNAAPQGKRASEALIRLAGAFGQLGNEKMRCSALAQYQRQTTKPDATLKARADAEMARSPCPPT